MDPVRPKTRVVLSNVKLDSATAPSAVPIEVKILPSDGVWTRNRLSVLSQLEPLLLIPIVCPGESETEERPSIVSVEKGSIVMSTLVEFLIVNMNPSLPTAVSKDRVVRLPEQLTKLSVLSTV